MPNAVDFSTDTSELLLDRPEHSKLGASGAERWMNCHGSVGLLKHLKLPETDDPEYRREGVTMHAAGAACLTEGLDAWEVVGQTFEGMILTAALANPIQVYLDYCRSITTDQRWIEYAISSPVHKDFYGRCDFGALSQELDGQCIHVVDLKGGEGIMVEVEENPQIKYYAFGLIDGLERQTDTVFNPLVRVRLVIVQPRGWHPDGPIRIWDTTVGAIKSWVHGVLVPEMNAAEFDNSLCAGPWCRFCPGKLVCPMLTAMFGAAAKASPEHIPDMNPTALGLNYVAAQGVKFYIKALEKQALQLQLQGVAVEGVKLVRKKANRVWNEGAADLAKAKFGPDALTEPEVRTPADLEKTVPAAKDWVKEFSFTPDTGYTVALMTDPGTPVRIRLGSEVFKDAIDAADG